MSVLEGDLRLQRALPAGLREITRLDTAGRRRLRALAPGVLTSATGGFGPDLSGPKRPDERHVTMLAYDRPAFVEDLAREVALALRETSESPASTGSRQPREHPRPPGVRTTPLGAPVSPEIVLVSSCTATKLETPDRRERSPESLYAASNISA